MASVAEILTEIKDLSKQLDARVAKHGPDVKGDVAVACATAIAHKISQLLAVTSKDLLDIEDAALELKNAPQAAVSVITTAATAALKGASVPGGSAGTKQIASIANQQTCLFPHRMMPQSILTQLENDSTTDLQAQELVLTQLKQCGITNMCPHSRKYVVALLATYHTVRTHRFPTYKSIYNEVQNVNRVLASCDVGPLSESLKDYGKDPNQWPRALYQQAYKDDDPPVQSKYDTRVNMVADPTSIAEADQLLYFMRRRRLFPFETPGYIFGARGLEQSRRHIQHTYVHVDPPAILS